MVIAGSATWVAAPPPGLRGQVRRGVPPGQAAERGVGEGDHRVEVAAGDRAEHQNDREQPSCGRRRVLHQLQAGLAGREPLGRDAGPDHYRGEERAAQELGQQPAP
jgi:hypothetical protein